MKKTTVILLFFISLLTLCVKAEIRELESLVPDETGYEVIYQFNPVKYGANDYDIDRSEALEGELTRLLYFLKLTGRDGKVSWVSVSLEPFTQSLADVGVPEGTVAFQDYVKNLKIASNVEGLATGAVEQGNIEFWPYNYGGHNAKKVPGASDKLFDFGDGFSSNGGYTSMQICNYQAKQVVFAFNNVRSGAKCDLGIGNNTSIVPQNGTSKEPNPDWTFAANGDSYKDALMIVAGRFNNLKIKEVHPFNATKVYLKGRFDKNVYKVNETMTFTMDLDWAGQSVKPGYYMTWSRRGDDGKVENGKVMVEDFPFTYKTSLDKPGFVHISAKLYNAKGKFVKKTGGARYDTGVSFEGGAGADIDTLRGIPEPEDFDAFWAETKARLNTVKFDVASCLTPVPSKNNAIKIFAVKIPCLGPRPVTGYLTMPANAEPKSLIGHCSFDGYSTNSIQRAPGGGGNEIHLHINAHGYELAQPDEYYKDFYRSISSNGKSYAFDAKQNEVRENAYFYGMSLRVIRSLQFVMAMPEWNGKNLHASGGSQGGLQTIWAAGLVPEVTRADANVPWCCDLGGQGGFNRIHGQWRVPYTRSIDYYDPINICKRISKTCMVNITRAGLGDYTCPPSGIAVLYNNIPSPKRIFWVQGSTHGYVPPYKDNQTFAIQTDDFK